MQILTPSVNADIRDFQQYVSGERIDGMFSTITAIGGLVTVASSGIVNLLYDKFGINTETAAQVMNDPEVMNKVLRNGSVVKKSLHRRILPAYRIFHCMTAISCKPCAAF